jgi:ADP-dependent NAD(P)H-hydrate dehydratase
MLTPIHVLPRLPRRSFDAHKGSFGKVLIAAGSRGMSGAAILCGRSALRAGAGLVQVAAPANVQAVVAAGNPCYTTLAIHQRADGTLSEAAATDVIEWGRAANALAIGPGLGHSPDVAAFVRQVVRELPRTPTVIDADGLNVLAPLTDEFKSRPCPLILTPHPGEFCRLSGKAMPDVEAHRQELAAEFAERFGVIVVLKGAGTVVTDGSKRYVNSTGNPGMATGGTGDVLTGIIAALLGQKLAALDAAVLGAWIHGRAGDLAAMTLGHVGLTAADMIEHLPQAFRDRELAC